MISSQKTSAALCAFFLMGLVHISIARQKPNIVFIFSDDHGYYDVGAYGNPEVHTPNIDKLAGEGMSFLRAYNMGSWQAAVCIPSRVMLNTGQFLWNAQRNMNENFIEWREQNLFWSQQLALAGYTTYFTGKWHISRVDPEEVFDHVAHVRPGMPGDREEGYNRPHPNREDPWSPSDPKLGGFWEGGRHWSEVLADDAVKFIDQASERDEPFFMYLAFNAPHDPRQSPEEYVDAYPPEEIRVPPNFLPRYPYKNPIGSGRVGQRSEPHPPGTSEETIKSSPFLRDERLAPFPRTEHAVRVHRQEYYALISHMDTQIGAILDALDKRGLTGHTLVIYTSDHGLAVGQHGLMGKQNMYEHSLRVPFIMKGPGIPSGKVSESIIYYQDVVPTTVEIAGGHVPEAWQYQSLLPVISGETDEGYPAAYAAYLHVQRSIMQWPYKLIVYPEIGRLRLFHLEEDPYEMNDLAEKGDKRTVTGRLLHLLKDHQQEKGDELDLSPLYQNWLNGN